MKNKERQIVFNKYSGRCAYCGCELTDKWQVDHAVSRCYWFMVDAKNPKAVNNVTNLNPACVPCNHYKRSHCVDSFSHHRGFRDFMLDFHKRLAKLPKKTSLISTQKRKEYLQVIADKYNITIDKPFSGVFYFETLIIH